MENTTIKNGDRVMVDYEGTMYPGTVTRVFKTKARIKFDDGSSDNIPFDEVLCADGVEVELSDADDPDTNHDPDAKAFNQYEVVWDDRELSFTMKVHGIEFHGGLRRYMAEGQMRYTLDIWAERDNRTYSVDTIPYWDEDPRADGIRELNADLCACVNKWFYQRCAGEATTLDDLHKRATRPILPLDDVRHLDGIIDALVEFRNDALASGGRRHLALPRYNDDDPEVIVRVDFTAQGIVQTDGGKNPHIKRVNLLSATTPTGAPAKRIPADRKPARTQRTKAITQSQYAGLTDDALFDALDAAREAKDKSAGRKIRAELRSRGIRGGASARGTRTK